jgi:hypothetical protein
VKPTEFPKISSYLSQRVSCVLGDNHLKVIKKKGQLSNSTVSRRIKDMSCNI